MPIYFVFALNVFNAASIIGNRVMLALFALHLGATPITVGILGAMFALFPTLLAVTAGRLCDRYGSRYLMMLGTTGATLGMLTPYFWPSLTTLMVAALMCGLSQVFVNVSTQNLTGLLSAPEDRARNFSNYALTNSAGQFAGPMLGGFAIDHLGYTSACLLMAVFASIPLFMLALRRKPLEADAVKRKKGDKPAPGVGTGALAMLKDPNIRRTLYTGSLLNSGNNLYLFYMPVYAHSVGVSASLIGIVIAMQSTAAFVVRSVLPWLISRWEEEPVLALSFFMGAASLLLIPFFQGAWMLGLLSFTFGLGMGVGQPIVTMQMFNNSAEGRSAEGLGLKMSTNNLTKLVSPVVFGAIASAFGLFPMFWLNALLLGTGGWLSRPKKNTA